MDIKGIGSNNFNTIGEVHKKPDAVANPVKVADKIEISKEAKLLQSSKVSKTDFSKIREKIDTGFYNKPEVVSKIADNILNVIAPDSK